MRINNNPADCGEKGFFNSPVSGTAFPVRILKQSIMMKRRILTVIMAAAAVALLTGCVRSGSSAGTGTGAASGGNSGQGTTASSGTDTASSGNAQQSAAEGSQAPASDASAAQEVDAGETYDMQNQAGDAPVAEPAGQDTEGTQWDGTYVSDAGETLAIQKTDEYSISFQFANCGISGTASVEGEQAVYHGDDNYQVVFEYCGGSIDVTASPVDQEDAEPSAVDGSYIRE